MKRQYLLLSVLSLLIGCAPYQQIKPVPELSPSEQGYIALKKDDKLVKLSKNKKYYIAFPPATEANSYLILNVPDKKSFTSFLLDSYVKKAMGKRLADESRQPATMSVYPVGRNDAGYFWMIENGPADLELNMQYRYAPQWRFKYETESAGFKKTLRESVVDRSVYAGLGTTVNLDGFAFAPAIDSVTRHKAELDGVLKKLLAIESIFPGRIVNSSDKAYLDYKDLKGRLEDEIAFQTNYLAMLGFHDKAQKVCGNVPQLMGAVEDFTKYFSGKRSLARNVVQESQNVLAKCLAQIPPYYEGLLSAKTDIAPLVPEAYFLKQFSKVGQLFDTAGVPTSVEFSILYQYVRDLDKGCRNVAMVRDSIAGINKTIKDQGAMPANEFFTQISAKVATIQRNLVKPLDMSHGKYLEYTCSKALNDEITRLSADVADQLSGYQEAAALVPQLNAMAATREFRGMLGVLQQKKHLVFLLDKYKKVDTLSIEQQKSTILDALGGSRWAQAEGALRELSEDNSFLNPQNVVAIKARSTDEMEDALYTGVDKTSRARIMKFVEEKFAVVENVDSLYQDSVFLPAYNITYSSGSRKELAQRQAKLVEDLARTKDFEFPAKAITLLFDEFAKNPSDNGVLKARAIVTHSRHYKGDDEKLKRKVAEVDPTSAKWIMEPKEYRRVYVLPTTTNAKGRNKYLFRVNIKIKTEAEFPVYDLNIKLPKEVAQNAAQSQWYASITMNDKAIKNEGRVSISAPSASNEYECQITPVSVNKTGNNYLEVEFEYTAFRVFTVSVMAQKPIIKKN